MTNAEKFKEVFGFTPQHCVAPARVCEEMNMKCRECLFNTFWDREYKECFKMRDDLETTKKLDDELLNLIRRTYRRWVDS